MKPAKRSPCNRICDCEWGSKMCFIKRGYIWNYPLGRWSRDEKGNCHRTANRDCDYIMPEQITLDDLWTS